ncbi:MAG: TetR/AcrR family transcriptional regulator [Pseudomonadales bacterium]|nr:TetR/AcrR family transcriptional regulator [Pseudomonadales bacterium]
MKTLTQREARKQEFREKIMAAAMVLFEAHGLEATQIADICETAGVSRPTFYSYYASKPVLIQSLGERIWLKVTGDFAADAMQKAQTPQAFVRAFFELALREITAFSRLEKELILRSMSQDSTDRMSVLSGLTDMFAAVYQRGADQQQISTRYPVDFLADMTMGSINAVMMNWATRDDYPIQKRLQQLADYIPAMLDLD